MDIVFIHGLRGGAFSTWRYHGEELPYRKGGEMGGCWPVDLAGELPDVRIMSVKYKTRITDWSGYTLSIEDLGSHIITRLHAAGVGARPVVFVTHSMGGLLMKQMLQYAREDPKYAAMYQNVRGVVFYSTPHFGSWLALGWQANVPPGLSTLVRTAPGVDQMRSTNNYLETLHQEVRALHQRGQLDVLSFAEGKTTPVMEVWSQRLSLKVDIVPMESSYPGFGEYVILPHTDHVTTCKPRDKDDPAYRKTRDFARRILNELDQEAASHSSHSNDS
eukprot:gene14719-17394_t